MILNVKLILAFRVTVLSYFKKKEAFIFIFLTIWGRMYNAFHTPYNHKCCGIRKYLPFSDLATYLCKGCMYFNNLSSDLSSKIKSQYFLLRNDELIGVIKLLYRKNGLTINWLNLFLCNLTRGCHVSTLTALYSWPYLYFLSKEATDSPGLGQNLYPVGSSHTSPCSQIDQDPMQI